MTEKFSIKKLHEKDVAAGGKYAVVGAKRGVEMKMFYKFDGDGPIPVVLVMGFVCSQHQWAAQVDFFRRDGRFTVITFDNRGTGYSRWGSFRGATTSGYAQDTAELLDHLGLDKVHLCGLSMGGMIAQEFASQFPDRLLSLTLCVTHAGGRYALGTPLNGVMSALTMETSRRRPDKINALMDMLYSPRVKADRFDEVYAWLMDTWIFHPVRPALAQMGACQRHYLSDARLAEIARLPIPKMVMTGTHDDLVNPYNSQILAEALNCPLVVFHNSGHMIHTEDSLAFNSYLLDHITQ